MEQRKEVGTKDSSLSTLHNTFLFIAFLLFPAFLPLPPFLFVGAYLLCAPSFFFFCFIGLCIFPTLLP